MAYSDIIVVGASAGGIPALMKLVENIPATFNGNMFVVLHIPPHSPSSLPEILTKAGNLKAIHPEDGEEIQAGFIYVAPPDHHMLLEKNRVVIKRGPKENRFRPSIDALFRSAAYVYGTRAVGVVLSGALNDGTSGLWSIQRLGGTTVIQDPNEAQHPEMPLNVIEYVDVDYTLPVNEISELIMKLSLRKANKKVKLAKKQLDLLELELTIAIQDNAFEMGIMSMGELSPFTCPECNGVLIQLIEGKIVRFRCHTGHAYTASALLGDLTESVDNKLWQAMRGMEETTMLLNKIGDHFKTIGQTNAAKQFQLKAEETAKRARVIHDSIFAQELISEDLRFNVRNLKQNKSRRLKS